MQFPCGRKLLSLATSAHSCRLAQFVWSLLRYTHTRTHTHTHAHSCFPSASREKPLPLVSSSLSFLFPLSLSRPPLLSPLPPPLRLSLLSPPCPSAADSRRGWRTSLAASTATRYSISESLSTAPVESSFSLPTRLPLSLPLYKSRYALSEKHMQWPSGDFLVKGREEACALRSTTLDSLHVFFHAHSPPQTHSRTHTHTHIHTYTHTHIHTYTQTNAHACARHLSSKPHTLHPAFPSTQTAASKPRQTTHSGPQVSLPLHVDVHTCRC